MAARGARGDELAGHQRMTDEIRLAYQKTHTDDSAGPCVTEEQLVRAATGEADGPERQRVSDHLIACARCAEEYRLLASLKPWAEESAAILNPEAARASAVMHTPSRWLAYAMAASLVLSFGVGSWVGAVWRQGQQPPSQARTSTLTPAVDSRGSAPERDVARVETVRQLADARRQVEDLRRRSEDQERKIAGLRRDHETTATPEPNVPIVELEAVDAFRGDPDRTRTIELPSSARLVMFVITAASGLPAGTYRVDMADQHGRVIWSSSGLHPGANDTFTLAVPRVLLPPGEAHLRLYGDRARGRELVDDYTVRFAYR